MSSHGGLYLCTIAVTDSASMGTGVDALAPDEKSGFWEISVDGGCGFQEVQMAFCRVKVADHRDPRTTAIGPPRGPAKIYSPRDDAAFPCGQIREFLSSQCVRRDDNDVREVHQEISEDPKDLLRIWDECCLKGAANEPDVGKPFARGRQRSCGSRIAGLNETKAFFIHPAKDLPDGILFLDRETGDPLALEQLENFPAAKDCNVRTVSFWVKISQEAEEPCADAPHGVTRYDVEDSLRDH